MPSRSEATEAPGAGPGAPARAAVRLDIVRRIPRFRGLISDAGGGVLGFRGPWLTRTEPPFDRVERLALLPGGWRRWAARPRLLSRLLRLDVHRMVQTSAGTLIATSAGGVARRAAGAGEFAVAFRDYRGLRPLSLCLDDEDRIYFGEYFSNGRREAVRIFMSEDDGRSWTCCYTFPARSIRHVHALEYDPHRRKIWVLTGDYGHEAQIGLATPTFAEYRVVAQGSQQARACGGVPTAAGLVYATDTPLEQNHVYLLDAETGAVRALADVQQSVLSMAEACGGLWLATSVEPSEVLPTQSVHVWFAPDDLHWTELYSAPRDRWSLRYFQFAVALLARGPRECPYVFLSFRGARGFDGDCLVGRISDVREGAAAARALPPAGQGRRAPHPHRARLPAAGDRPAHAAPDRENPSQNVIVPDQHPASRQQVRRGRMARVGLLLTVTQWNDRRQYYRQGPALLAAGHEVVYLAGSPEGELRYGYEAIPLSAGERRAARLTGGLNLFRKIARARLDVLQICSLELVPLGIAAKLLGLTKVVYDCREDMPSAMRDHKPRFPKPVRIVLSSMTRLLESIGDRLFDGLVTADPATANLHAHMPEDRKVVFYNVASTKHFPVDGPGLAERTYDVGILGSITERSGLFDVVRAAALLRARGLRLKVLIVGKQTEGPFQNKMKALIDELDLTDQFQWRGPVDHLEVPKLLYNTRIGIVSLPNYIKFQHNIASKAFEFIAARMVTVATDLPPQRIFLKHDHNAVLYEPGNVAELARILSSLLGDLEAAQKMADRARQDFLSEWNLELMMGRYTSLFDRVAGDSRHR